MEWNASELKEIHNRRIKRPGYAFWHTIIHLNNRAPEKITGKFAMDIQNLYGLSPQNVILLCSTHGREIDLEEYCTLLNEEENKPKSVRPIAHHKE